MDGFDQQIVSEMANEVGWASLPDGSYFIPSPVVTVAGEVRVSSELLTVADYDRRFGRGTHPRKVPVSMRLRQRASDVRERVALWIAPWLSDADDY
jgi:hypothetical protein